MCLSLVCVKSVCTLSMHYYTSFSFPIACKWTQTKCISRGCMHIIWKLWGNGISLTLSLCVAWIENKMKSACDRKAFKMCCGNYVLI
jgi:hypothetical protein